MKLTAFAIFVVFTYFLQLVIVTNTTNHEHHHCSSNESDNDNLLVGWLNPPLETQQQPSAFKNARNNSPPQMQIRHRSLTNSSEKTITKSSNETVSLKQSSNTFFSSLQSVLQSLTTDIEEKIKGKAETEVKEDQTLPTSNTTSKPENAKSSKEEDIEEELEFCEMLNGTSGYCQPRMHCIMQEPEQRRFTVCEWSGGKKNGLFSDEDEDDSGDEMRRTVTGEGELSTRSPPARLCCPQVTIPLDQLKLQFEEWVDKTKAEMYALGLPKKPDGRCGVVMAAPYNSFKATQQRNAKTNQSEEEEVVEKDTVFLRKDTSKQEVRIVQGRNAGLGQYPWMVAIFFRRQFICGGSILSDRVLLTAAHCFSSSRNPKEYSIRYESVRMYNGTELQVAKIRVHEDYHPPAIYNDIALVFLTEPVTYSELVQPVCLPGKRMINELMIGLTGHVVGYGDLSFGGEQASVLQEVDVKIINGSFCDSHYRRLVESGKKFRQGIGRSLICAGWQEGGKDACQGDSGGPLTVNYRGANYLVGLVSFGYRCALPKFPGVYTAIAHYLKWIFENLQL